MIGTTQCDISFCELRAPVFVAHRCQFPSKGKLMTLVVKEQEELIRAIRSRLPPKGETEYQAWSKTAEATEWAKNWHRLFSSEIQVALKSFLNKKFSSSTVQDRDDVVQDVLTVFYRKVLFGYDVEKAGAAGMFPYLRTIAANAMLARFKAANKYTAFDELILQVADDHDVDSGREAKESLTLLREHLTEKELIVLEGKLQESTLAEIGRQLGIDSTGKVDHIWQRVRRKAVQLLGDSGEIDEQDD